MVKQDFKEHVNEPMCHIAVFSPSQPCHNMYSFEEGKPTTEKMCSTNALYLKKKKKEYWVKFSGHNFHVEVHIYKWQRSACFGTLSIFICGSVVRNNDVGFIPFGRGRS